MLPPKDAPLQAASSADINCDAPHQNQTLRLDCDCGDCQDCRCQSALPFEALLPDHGVADAVSTGLDANTHHHNTNHAFPCGDTAISDRLKTEVELKCELSNAAAPMAAVGPNNGMPRFRACSDHAASRGHDIAMNAAVVIFGKIAGQMPLGQSTPADVGRFVEALRAKGKTEAMVLRHLNLLTSATRALDAFDSDVGLPNPFAQAAQKIRTIKQSAPHRPSALSLDEVQKLLSSHQFQELKACENQFFAARFWAPLLCLMTYSQTSELARLKVTDLERHENAWFLRRDGKNVVRLMPLHEELLRCGFVTYVEKRKMQGAAKIFGDDSDDMSSYHVTWTASRWFSDLGKTLGLGNDCSLNSLGGTFMAACINSGISNQGIQLLAGTPLHRLTTWRLLPPSDSHGNLLSKAVSWMNRLTFNGLDLSHLYVDDPFGIAARRPSAARPKVPRHAQ